MWHSSSSSVAVCAWQTLRLSPTFVFCTGSVVQSKTDEPIISARAGDGEAVGGRLPGGGLPVGGCCRAAIRELMAAINVNMRVLRIIPARAPIRAVHEPREQGHQQEHDARRPPGPRVLQCILQLSLAVKSQLA